LEKRIRELEEKVRELEAALKALRESVVKYTAPTKPVGDDEWDSNA